MTWLAYIGPGEGFSHGGLSAQAQWAVLVALAAFALVWWVSMNRGQLSEERCLGLALVAAIVFGITTRMLLILELSRFVTRTSIELLVVFLAPVLLAGAFAATGALLLGLGRFLYSAEVPAAIARGAQRPWLPGAR